MYRMSEKSGINGKNLQERLTEACAAVHPDMLKRIQRNMVHRYRKCVGVGRGHVENILSKQLVPDFSDILYLLPCLTTER
jgi:hypothetical protein